MSRVVAKQLGCLRCVAVITTVPELERHLVEFHLMGSAQAKDEAKAPRPDNGRVTTVDEIADHCCPKCGTEIACDWRGIAALEREAHRLNVIAGMWRVKLAGGHIGRPRVNHFDVEEVRKLVATGLSLRATGRILGVHATQISRALKAPPEKSA